MLATPDPSALSAYKGQSAGCPPEQFKASPTLQAASESCVTRSRRRRSTASAMEPPKRRAGEHWSDLRQAHEPHVQRGMGQLEHLVRDRDHSEL